jgi:hypothetical protein
MAEKKDLSTEDAQKECFDALDKETTTKITLVRQDDNIEWTITVVP